MYLYVYFYFSVLRVLHCTTATLTFDPCQTVSLPSRRHCFVLILRLFLASIFLISGTEKWCLQWFYAVLKKVQCHSCGVVGFIWVVFWRLPYSCALEFSLCQGASFPRCCLILKRGSTADLPPANTGHKWQNISAGN